MTKQEFMSVLEEILEFEGKRVDEFNEDLHVAYLSEYVKNSYRKMRYSHMYARDLVNDLIELAKTMED